MNITRGVIQPGPKRWVQIPTDKGHRIQIENSTKVAWELDDHGMIAFSAVAEYSVYGLEWLPEESGAEWPY